MSKEEITIYHNILNTYKKDYENNLIKIDKIEKKYNEYLSSLIKKLKYLSKKDELILFNQELKERIESVDKYKSIRSFTLEDYNSISQKLSVHKIDSTYNDIMTELVNSALIQS